MYLSAVILLSGQGEQKAINGPLTKSPVQRIVNQGYGETVVSEIFSNYGFEIVVGMIFAVLATLFYRVIYFSYFNKK